MSAKVFITLAVGAAAVLAGALNLPKAPATQRPHGLVGKAPAFTGSTPDGKSFNLALLTKNGPGYLYFIKKDCPINAEAVSFFNHLYQSYGPATPMLGVFNGSADEYKAYQRDHHMPFPVVLDPDQKIISDYMAERSPWIVEVKANGLVGHIWQGYDQDYLNQISRALATATHKPVARLDFSAAPTNPAYG